MYLINRDNGNNVTNPVYSAAIEPTIKEDLEFEEHIYDSINDVEHKVELKGMGLSTAYQHRLQNPYDHDDRISIKSDDVTCDHSVDYRIPNTKEDGMHSTVSKPVPKPRHTNETGGTPVVNAESINKNLSHDDEYVLQYATQKVSHDDYVLHDATQRVNHDDYVSLDTAHTPETEEYVTQAVTHTVESNEYSSVDIAHRITDNDYQEIVRQPSPPPGYSVPSNIPATS